MQSKLAQCYACLKTLGILLLCLCVTGCITMGTCETRVVGDKYEGGAVFGKPLYTAVYEDSVAAWRFVTWGYPRVDIYDDDNDPFRGFFMLCSLPFDIALDTVFLPVDLIAWACGYDKRNTQK